MENLYRLEKAIKDNLGVPYTLVIGGDNNERQRLKAAINTKSVWNKDFVIDLFFAEKSGSGPIRFLDTHFWDLGRPAAFITVVSPALKLVLDKFSIPAHTYYEISIGTKTERKDYFLLHLLYDNKKELDFSKTAFRKYKMPKELITEDNPPIFFKDYNDFVQKQTALVVSNFFYESEHYVYSRLWDVMWGGGFKTLISSAVVSVIEQVGLTGIHAPIFDGYKISSSGDN